MDPVGSPTLYRLTSRRRRYRHPPDRRSDRGRRWWAVREWMRVRWQRGRTVCVNTDGDCQARCNYPGLDASRRMSYGDCRWYATAVADAGTIVTGSVRRHVIGRRVGSMLHPRHPRHPRHLAGRLRGHLHRMHRHGRGQSGSKPDGPNGRDNPHPERSPHTLS